MFDDQCLFYCEQCKVDESYKDASNGGFSRAGKEIIFACPLGTVTCGSTPQGPRPTQLQQIG